MNKLNGINDINDVYGIDDIDASLGANHSTADYTVRISRAGQRPNLWAILMGLCMQAVGGYYCYTMNATVLGPMQVDRFSVLGLWLMIPAIMLVLYGAGLQLVMGGLWHILPRMLRSGVKSAVKRVESATSHLLSL